ncbi:MAG: MFS transporter [Terriglobia bacterium]
MLRQRWLHVIPAAFIMYTIAFIDRTNISLALPSISHDLHMNPVQAGEAAGVFYWGFLLLQVPGGHLARHWSAKRFISILLILWGVCAVAGGLVRNWQEFWTLRLLLGVAEGGVWPAVLVLLSDWFPRAERGRANALWMLCLPTAVVVSSPVSGWILGRWDWRVLLVSEGILPFVWLIAWWQLIDDHPNQARWISNEERDYLIGTLRTENQELQPTRQESYLKSIARPAVLVMIVIYFLQTTGGFGFLYWLPSAIEREKHLSHFVVGILFAIPFVAAGIFMVLNSYHSDRRHERRAHVAGPLALGGVLLGASVFTADRWPLLSFIFVCFAAVGPNAPLGPFWAIPTETLPPAVSGSAMGVINAFGSLGGFCGPLLVGYLEKRTGNFHYAFGALSLAFLIAALLAVSFLPRRRMAASEAGAALPDSVSS